jgi:hypothetical protein
MTPPEIAVWVWACECGTGGLHKYAVNPDLTPVEPPVAIKEVAEKHLLRCDERGIGGPHVVAIAKAGPTATLQRTIRWSV